MTSISLRPLLSLSLRPVRVWIIEAQKTQSIRNVEVIQRQKRELELAERAEVHKQIRLNIKQRQLERRQ